MCKQNKVDIAGYMPKRNDFDIEYDNDAEALLADMEFEEVLYPCCFARRACHVFHAFHTLLRRFSCVLASSPAHVRIQNVRAQCVWLGPNARASHQDEDPQDYKLKVQMLRIYNEKSVGSRSAHFPPRPPLSFHDPRCARPKPTGPR